MPNKEQSQKNPSKSYCGRCGKERSPIMMCRCAGGGSSGGGSSETKSKDNVDSFSRITNTSSQAVGKSTQTSDKSAWVLSQLCSDQIINYEAKSLSIMSDGFGGNLIFRVNTGLSNDEVKKGQEFLKAVKNEFEEFKDQLTKQGIGTKDFIAYLKENELTIHIPKPHYVAFIKHLESKKLLPVPNPEHEEKKETLRSAKEDKQQTFNPKPLSTRLERK